VSTTQSASTSAAMGDASGKSGLGTVILDSYGRAFEADLGGTIRRAPIATKLAPALGIGTRSLGASAGATAISLSVGGDGDIVAVNRLLLSPHDERAARALAGSVVTRL
ncbi:hypothetical protein, partial [Klebsiella pneumoniae]|uniref:hypothetical protein n=1 Tax=Klebsiella pneumoniae TaxID=573 RepID=UPI00210BAED5